MTHKTLKLAHRAPVIGGFPTSTFTRDQLANLMVQDCLAARKIHGSCPRLVFSSNGQGIALAGKDPNFAEAMKSADIIHADGMSVVYASRLTSAPLPERIATTDFFHDAAVAGSRSGLRFFMLGGTSVQNENVVKSIAIQYPNLNVVGAHHGYFDSSEDEQICELVRNSNADVLWVGLGKPRQEYWSVRNKDQLKGLGWVKTCGGLYSFLVGDVPRAPVWMQNVGMEWLHRTIKDPRRLAWRYVSTNPYAMYRLLRYTEHTRLRVDRS